MVTEGFGITEGSRTIDRYDAKEGSNVDRLEHDRVGSLLTTNTFPGKARIGYHRPRGSRPRQESFPKSRMLMS